MGGFNSVGEYVPVGYTAKSRGEGTGGGTWDASRLRPSNLASSRFSYRAMRIACHTSIKLSSSGLVGDEVPLLLLEHDRRGRRSMCRCCLFILLDDCPSL